MFKKTKTTLGVIRKQRTKEEIDREYSAHAAQYGHKSFLIEKLSKDAEKLQVEIARHLEKLAELNAEGFKAQTPKEVPPTPPEVA